LAVIQGNLSVVNLLLANNADVNALDNEGHSVVHWATGKFLITYKLLITLTDGFLFFFSKVCGEIESLRAVLGAGANISTPDINGGSPLHYAAQMCGANYEGKSNKTASKLALVVMTFSIKF
jgi:ankyrin repeat protein